MIDDGESTRLLLVLVVAALLLLGCGSHALALDTTRAASTVWRSEGEVDVLLRVETDDEGRNVDNLLANAVMVRLSGRYLHIMRDGNVPDVPLADKDTSVVDGLGQAALEDLSLQATLQEVLDLQGQHVIETHAGLIEHTNADETANEGVTLEETLRVLVIELEQLTSRTTDLGKDETNAPDLALVA